MPAAMEMRFAIVVLAACAGRSSSTSGAAIESPPPHATPASSEAKPMTPKQWWCYTLPANDIGSCFAQKIACQAARAVMANSASDPAERLTECAAQPTVSCFVSERAGGASETMCHPTMSMCRDHADHEQQQRGVSRVNACASSDPSVVQDDAHWWCMTFLGGKISSCSRSKARCEDDRNKAIELQRGHPIDVSACTELSSAKCFVIRLSSGDARMSCHGTIETCRSELGRAKRDRSASAQDCVAVE
jgi:hypothetical protein